MNSSFAFAKEPGKICKFLGSFSKPINMIRIIIIIIMISEGALMMLISMLEQRWSMGERDM